MEILTGVASILLGGGVLAFVQFLINRHDTRNDRQEEVLKAVGKLCEKVDKIEKSLGERDAIQSRTHILRFRDELYDGMKHSQEYFDQVIDDAELYERYCEKNPDFANGRTKAAVRYIRDEYDRLFKEHKL